MQSESKALPLSDALILLLLLLTRDSISKVKINIGLKYNKDEKIACCHSYQAEKI